MAKQPEVRQGLAEAIENNPKLGLFVHQLTMNDGDYRAAAEAVGWTRGYGTRLKKRYPEIQAIVTRLFEATAVSIREQWARMHTVAMARAAELLGSDDERVVLETIKLVVERVEGRPRQGVDLSLVEREEDKLESVRYRFALALSHHKAGMTLEAALQYADEHPDDVEAWWGHQQGDFEEAAEA